MSLLAIAHDYLTQRGGAERVVVALCKAFPDAPLHTTLYNPPGTYHEFAEADISTTALQHFAPFRKDPRIALPLLAPAVSRHPIDAAVTLCSTAGWAHGFPTTGAKVAYVHNTARWLYQRDEYLANLPAYYGWGLATIAPLLRRWDQRAAATVDVVIANSNTVRDRVRRNWGREAHVLHPPPGLAPEGPRTPTAGLEPGYLLAVSRLLPYKRVDVLVEGVAERQGERLVIVGDGPDRERIEALATERARGRVQFITHTDDAHLRWLYENAKALVTASHEDFGLTPLEAMSLGTPAIAVAEGGFLETVTPTTGILFEAPTPASFAAALDQVGDADFDLGALREQAEKFSEASFIAALRGYIAEYV